MGFCHDQVGAAGEFEAAAERRAVQDRDQRLAQPGQPVEHAVAVADPVPAEADRIEPRPGLDVAAGGEGLFAGAGQDRDAHGAVPLGRRHPVFDRLDHQGIERIQLLRPIQGQDRDRAADLGADAGLAHAPLPSRARPIGVSQ